MKKVFHCALFTGIFIILYIYVTELFIPKWYPPDSNEPVTQILQGIYEEPANSVDVCILGTSNVFYGISPMELWINHSITSYNLASPGQPIWASYYWLKEFCKKQSPQVVVLDASRLYLAEDGPLGNTRKSIDTMRTSLNKLEFIQAAVTSAEDSRIGYVLPLINYHSRWADLTQTDFSLKLPSDILEYKGYLFSQKIFSSAIQSDPIQEGLEDKPTKRACEYLKKIIEFCEEKNMDFLVMKVPSLQTWDARKSAETQELCEKLKIPFLDLTNKGLIDDATDWTDNGYHLNNSGAVKITAFLGDYILEHYDISSRNDPFIHDSWAYEAAFYEREKEFFALKGLDVYDYLKELSKTEDINIYISVKDDAGASFNSKLKSIFRSMTLKVNLHKRIQQSYIAVIENGIVLYEDVSKSSLNYESEMQNGTHIQVTSAGVFYGDTASIKINDKEYALNCRGLNIVVYDNIQNKVVDQVVFDTNIPQLSVLR